MKINRREFLFLSGELAVGCATSRKSNGHTAHSIPHFQIPLHIPPVLSPVRSDTTTDFYDVVQQQSEIEILNGSLTTIWGYDGITPGPTIKARRGRTTVVRFSNQLAVPTAVHLHGGVTPPDSDGFPADTILPHQSRVYTYPNDGRAATLWYHDHAMHHTGRNIYMGLAGFYVLEDDEEKGLGLPQGSYDVPLMIQDRMFSSDGSLVYDTFHHLAAKGEIVLVNGVPWPRMEVAARKYRFRILNASNATPFRLALSTGKPLILIATDGGLVRAPARCPNIPLAMAERIEVIIDFSEYPVGTRVVLQNLNTEQISGEPSDEIMQFEVVRKEEDDSIVPEHFSNYETLNPNDAVRTRNFTFSGRPSFGLPLSAIWKINGKEFDANHPIASPRYGDVEIWNITNKSLLGFIGMLHPVHVHLVNFRILQRNGKAPLPHETGWKDTVAVNKGEEVKVAMRFQGYKGRYLIHCHNLEHEDHSMMARFDVV
ncbi:multicopper oxidase domain-containing protein [bacterium]|nr:multicopper oxidase domain-containing protein [bacterium]